jgi:hypothetical protein
MRILVTGGRDYWQRAVVFRTLDAVHRKHGITLLIEGGAGGADHHARGWAKSRGVPYQTFYADWRKYGRAVAGKLRNGQMLSEGKPEAVVAFPGDTGTADMVAKAEAARVPVWKTGGWPG